MHDPLREAWHEAWSLVAAALITGAVFVLGYGLGVDLARTHALSELARLVDRAAGLGLICVACSIYRRLGPDVGWHAQWQAGERGAGGKLALLAAAYLAAGALTGIVAVRVIG